jgi:hypothetical protein
MTKEQVLINHIQEYLDSGMWQYEACYLNKNDLKVIIKALDQEPCEDAISRQTVINALCDGCELFKNGEQTCRSKCEEYHFLATLPPVIPQPKIGHWNTYKLSQGGIDEEWLECSECMWSNALSIPRNYCPNCGCRMEGSK